MASPMLAMLNRSKSGLGCSKTLKTIKSITQYRGNFDVPRASSDVCGSKKHPRYYAIPAEPLDAFGTRKVRVLLRRYNVLIESQVSMMPKRPASGDGIFGCLSRSKSPAASPGTRQT
jgi:hypothetical protein